MFYNDFLKDLITDMKKIYPQFDYFASIHSWSYDIVEKSYFDAIDNHMWFEHHGGITGSDKFEDRKIENDYRKAYTDLRKYWIDNKSTLIDWMDNKITIVAELSRKLDVVCGNTEGWGNVCWWDHPEIDWKWIKESGDICVDLALKHKEYRFICTSNFTHPHFRGMWEDIEWHRKITSKIKSR